MEKKILNWVTSCMGVLTLLVCLCLYFFPNIKQTIVLAAETMAGANVQELDIQIQESGAAKEQKQLNIELPEGVEGKDITITNDYFTKTVYVRFAKGVDDYSNEYSVRGSSNNIASLSYYKDGEAYVLEIGLDKACELSYFYKDGYLCMELVDPHEIYDKIIVIDAGHGGRQPGAVKKDIYEKDLNLDIVKQIKEVFEEAGHDNIKIYYTRLTDTNPTLEERVDLANNLNADLFISIHNNASSSGRFTDENGTMVLYSPGDEGSYTSTRLAEICLEHVTESTGSTDLGLVDGDYVYIVRTSKVPVALVEVGYMTNTDELENLQDAEYQRKVAEGVYNAIMAAFEEGF